VRKVQNLEGKEVIFGSQELFEPYLVVVPEPDGEEQHEYDGYPDEGGQEEQEQDGGTRQYQGLQQHPTPLNLLSSEMCKKVASLYVIGATLLQLCQRMLAAVLQICYRGSEGNGNPLANFLQGIRGF
jgi:hypothetical protein